MAAQAAATSGGRGKTMTVEEQRACVLLLFFSCSGNLPVASEENAQQP